MLQATIGTVRRRADLSIYAIMTRCGARIIVTLDCAVGSPVSICAGEWRMGGQCQLKRSPAQLNAHFAPVTRHGYRATAASARR